MKQTRQAYTVLKPLNLANAPYRKDDTVHLYPKQATYLVTGGFLAPAKPTKTKPTTASKAKE